MQPVSLSESDKYSSFIQPWLLALADYIAILLAEVASHLVRDVLTEWFWDAPTTFRLSADYFFIWIPLVFMIFLHWGRTYIRLVSVAEMIRKTFYAVCLAIISCIVALFLANKSPVISRLFVVLLGGFVFVFVSIARLGLRSLLTHLKLFLEPTIIVGSDATAVKLLRYATSTSFFGIQVVGIIDDNPKGKALEGHFPLLGGTDQAKEIVLASGVQNVLILAPNMPKHKLTLLVESLFPVVKNVSYVPDTEEMPISNMELRPLYSENMVVISVKNNLSRAYNRIFKRIFDLVVATLGTIAISPILLGIALAIKRASPGPVFYSHKRIGHNGEYFQCWKFRSMVVDSDVKLKEYLEANPEARIEWEENQKLKNDPRVTKIGHILRKTSLDELPQLWNVIKGEMSLVGPRPIVDNEVEKYGIYFADYKMVKPGMTGLWQTSGRSDTSYPRRVRMDAWYVRNWNVWLDISLLVKTVKVVFSKQSGAY
jgi:undecaprenyl-phosphate galactose phosphotransferase